VTSKKGNRKSPRFMTPRTRIQNCMYFCMYVCSMLKISFALDLGRSFDSGFLKHGKTIVSIKNWSCIVFASIRPNEGRGGNWRLRKFENFQKMKSQLPIFRKFNGLITCFEKCCFSNFWLNRCIWRQIRGHNAPEDGVL